MIRSLLSRLGYERIGPAQAKPPEPTRHAPSWRPNIPQIDPSLRLDEWRSTDSLITEMGQFLKTRFGKDVVSCLINECRVRQNLPNPTSDIASIELGRIAGHQEAVDILLMMAVPNERPVDIPITYPAPEAFPKED